MIRTLLAVALSVCAPWAAAQIVIGQTAGFTGAEAASVKENTEGAKLVFERVNAGGGINGQKIELVSLDDQRNPKLAIDNAMKLANQHNVLALLLSSGTAPTLALKPLLEEHKLPLVAPASGAMALRTPVQPWIYAARAPYQREMEKAVQHLVSTGVTRVALAHVDDPFGADAAAGVLRALDRSHQRAAFLLKFKGDRPDMSAIVAGVMKLDIQAVVILGPAAAVADATRQLRAKGSRATVVTGSNNASPEFIKLLGDAGRGVIVTQVMPFERSSTASIVKEAYDLAAAKGISEVTPAMLEGFAGAKVLVEALRRAGNKPTRQKLRDALDGMNKVDIGGLEVRYSPQDHGGLDYADLSIIGPDSRFHR
ncbi:ABC transporter substrate-binding protein [Ideonella sp. BN130291]|uniref:ABC transporter substrate-binding protein n=1 Tax=Ideonella sp. BN130291 TaxID=3112940 RepID=UPI002E25DA73|nr:ABC transporter substrate-binding protein [Ideonella sp. BN130291]